MHDAAYNDARVLRLFESCLAHWVVHNSVLKSTKEAESYLVKTPPLVETWGGCQHRRLHIERETQSGSASSGLSV
jgi:hypothetical protein